MKNVTDYYNRIFSHDVLDDLKKIFRASLCIPDPEKRSYDLLDITPWSTKTKSHFTDPETLQDIGNFTLFQRIK